MQRSLTPSDIADLRASIRWRGSVGSEYARAYVVYIASDERFGLIADGRIMATSASLDTLAACLVAERAEPGFIRRVLDTAEPCDVASLDPAGRARANTQRAAEAARIRQLDAEADAERRRRARQLDVTKLELDDL